MVPERVRHLYATFRHLIHEIARFGIIGAISYVFTVLVSNWLRYGRPGLGPLTSLGIAMIIAATFSYFANRHWTWRHKARTGVSREYGLFLALSVIGFGITEIPLAISEYVLGLHSRLAYNISGNLIGTALGMVWRFWSFKRWVFIEPEPARTDDAAHEALV
jgi:putative flippase GtrA